MRKIEREMVQAIIDDCDHWCKANTSVIKDADGVHHVYLHGSEIAQVEDLNIRVRHAGYRTNTTKSRLNCILRTFGTHKDGIYQKNHIWFFHDGHLNKTVEMSQSGWYGLSDF